MVHVLWKPGLENFEHYFASLWDECSCAVVWAFFSIAFLRDWKESWHKWQSPQQASFSGENLKAFPLKSGTRQGCLLSSLSAVWEGLATAIRKKYKRNSGWKRSKTLSAGDMILNTENPKNAIRKLIRADQWIWWSCRIESWCTEALALSYAGSKRS